MNLSFYIARRYFFSKRKKNFINIISLLSMGGVAFATAALIIVLSVFNGLGDLLRSLYTAFDPQLKIEAVKGKSFELTDSLKQVIIQTHGVKIMTEVIEDFVYVRYRQADILNGQEDYPEEEDHYQLPKSNAEMVVTMKGVSDNFIDQHRLDNNIIAGDLSLYQKNLYGAIIGRGVRNTLSVSMENEFVPLEIYYVKNLKGNTFNPSEMYSKEFAMPTCVFTIEKNYDENFIFVPLDLAKDLMNYGDRRTSLEVQLEAGASVSSTQQSLKEKLGSNFRVLTNDEQHSDLYRILKVEKLFMALSLALLIAIASINIFFSLMMLVIDKRKDISVLSAMGATPSLIQKIFMTEAFIISGMGAGAGMLAGAIMVWLQDNVGLVGMGMENSIVPDYPVKMVITDFVFIAVIIIGVTAAMAWSPAKSASKTFDVQAL